MLISRAFNGYATPHLQSCQEDLTPFYPQFDRSSIDIVGEAKAAGVDPVKFTVEQLIATGPRIERAGLMSGSISPKDRRNNNADVARTLVSAAPRFVSAL